MSDPVNHPDHYNAHPSGVEAIEICEHLSFCVGTAVKYVWRAGEKGSRQEDLQKAVWYLERAIESGVAARWPAVSADFHEKLRVIWQSAPETLLGKVLWRLAHDDCAAARDAIEVELAPSSRAPDRLA